MTVSNDALSALVLADLRDVLNAFLLGEDEDVDPDEDLLELGFDSISLAEFVEIVERRLGVELSAATIFEAPNLRQLTDHLLGTSRSDLLRHYGDRVTSAAGPER